MQRSSILLCLALTLSSAAFQLDAACGAEGGREYSWQGAPDDFQHKILGTWALVSVEALNPDGSRSQPFGPHPVGRAVFDSRGNFIFLNMAAAMPSAGNRPRASVANGPAAPGSEAIGLFGTYTVDEAARTLIWHIVGCTSPNWAGGAQTHSIELLTEDELRTQPLPAAPGEAVSLFTWRRFK
jgi:hypothetical protein